MGETAIVVLVPEAEPLLGAHRRVHTTEGAHGMGAHVTLLYPFGDDADGARAVLSAFPPFGFALTTAIRFPENPAVLCLRPEPDTPFRAMTAALAAAFPEHPPYGGKYSDPIPHATVAIGDDAMLDAIEREVTPSLPIAAHVTGAALMEQDDAGEWRVRGLLPFASAEALA